MSNDTIDTLNDNFHAALVGVSDAALKLELFNTIDDLAREGLDITAPVDVTSAAPENWLPSAQWVPNYQALLNGVLARMYGQPDKPYSSPALAQAHTQLYTIYLSRARAEAASVTPASVYARLVADVRTRLPMVRDASLVREIYIAVDKVRREAFVIAQLDDTFTDPTAYLTDAQYATAYQAILHGTLFGLYGQIGKEWSSPELAKSHAALFLQESDRVRAEAAGVVPATVYARLLADLRTHIPEARDAALIREIYGAVDKIRREALVIAPLDDTFTDPTAYLTDTQYAMTYRAVLHGALFGMYAQVGKVWASPDLAKSHMALFQLELDRVRAEAAGTTPATVYARIVADLRTRIPGARDAALIREVYIAVDKVRREALRIAPLDETFTDPTAYLTSAQYAQTYQAVLNGALFGLYAQVGKEWASLDLAKIHIGLFKDEIAILRGTSSYAAPYTKDNAVARFIIAAARMLPGVNNDVIRFEAFNVFNDFFNDSSCWLEALSFNVLPNVTAYDIVPTQGQVIRLAGVVDSHGTPQPAMMPNFGQVVLSRIPSITDTFTAAAVLNVTQPTNKDDMPIIPDWALSIYGTGISAGLLGRMMTQKNKSYSDQTLGIYQLKVFKDTVTRARVATMRNNTFGTQDWYYPQAFRTRGQHGGVSVGNDTRFSP